MTMERLLLGCNCTAVFVDDIIVSGRSESEHLENLRIVLDKLKKAGFTANLKKCSFYQKSVNYLGYVIDANGLHKDDSKVKAILGMPHPRSTTEVKAFCGMVQYYARFIPHLSTVLKPLYELTGKSEAKWSSKCSDAFVKVKEMICSDLVLAHFDPEIPVAITTDASEVGIGACLSHLYPNGKERPIAFVSRILSKSESNYSTI